MIKGDIMKNLRSTVGCVGKDCVVLKDNSIFKKGEIVVVLSSDDVNELIQTLIQIGEDIDTSKRWIDEIKKLK